MVLEDFGNSISDGKVNEDRTIELDGYNKGEHPDF